MCQGSETQLQANGAILGADRGGVDGEAFTNGNPDSTSTNYGYISVPYNATFSAFDFSYTFWLLPRGFSAGDGAFGIMQTQGPANGGLKLYCLNTGKFQARVFTCVPPHARARAHSASAHRTRAARDSRVPQ